MRVYALSTGKILLPFAIRGTRKDVVKFAKQDYIGGSWKEIEAKGYSVRPCEIKPIGKEKK
jgi:hypothetical protein